jgi:transposase InsO family protein
LNRFRINGENGLCDGSRAPKSHPNGTPEAIKSQIIIFRQQHPHWGPRKIKHRLSLLKPEIKFPASSTIGEILKRSGLAAPRRRRIRTPPFKRPLSEGLNPNDLWTADFKGWFQTRDGARIDPLTISDAASRYLLRCRIVDAANRESVQAQFTSAFQEFGLPKAIRTDNGPPFASTAVGGLSRLSVWFVRLGISPERINPGHPEENGGHERMHLTLKQATAKPPKANKNEQQSAFDRFRDEYNHERPHEALNMETPREFYEPSDRKFPNRLPELEYPADAEVRRVRHCGAAKWRGRYIYIGKPLTGEKIAFTESEDGEWTINFGTVQLGVWDARTNQVRRS